MSWPENLPRIIVQSERVCARYDAKRVIRKIRRSRENYAVAIQRARRVVLHSNRRNAFHRWARITKLSQNVALRFWWNILKSQTRRARLACTESLTSDPIVARLDASIVSIRDIARTGRISLTVRGVRAWCSSAKRENLLLYRSLILIEMLNTRTRTLEMLNTRTRTLEHRYSVRSSE